MGWRPYYCRPNDNSSPWVGYPRQVALQQGLLAFCQPMLLLSVHLLLSRCFSLRCFPLDFTGFSGCGEFGVTLGQDNFDVRFLHCFTDFPVDNITTKAIQYAAQVVTGTFSTKCRRSSLTFSPGENFLRLFAVSISFRFAALRVFDLHTNSNSGNVQFRLKHYRPCSVQVRSG